MGALTSKPYAFRARSWELRSIDSIDVYDGEGANTRTDIRGNQVMRVLPRINYAINLDWISDRTRFSYDGLSSQRLRTPLIFGARSIDWQTSLHSLTRLLGREGRSCVVIPGRTLDQATTSELQNLTSFNRSYVVNNFSTLDMDLLSDLGVVSYEEVLVDADFHLLVGTNLAQEAPITNLRLRRSIVQSQLVLHTINANNQGFDEGDLRNSGGLSSMLQLAEGRSLLSRSFLLAKKPVIWLSSALARRADAFAWLTSLRSLRLHHPALTIGLIHSNVAATALTQDGLGSSVLDAHRLVLENSSFLNMAATDSEFVSRGSVVAVDAYCEQDSAAKIMELPLLLPQEKNGVYINNEFRHQNNKIVLSSTESDAKASNHVYRALAIALIDVDSGTSCFQNNTVNTLAPMNFKTFISNGVFSLVRLAVTSMACLVLGHPYRAETALRLSRNLSLGSELLVQSQSVNFYELR